MCENNDQRQPIVFKLPNKNRYILKLKKMVKARKGKLDDYVLGQIEIAATVWRRFDKIDAELECMPSVIYSVGSTGQDKSYVNPLLPEFTRLTQKMLDCFKSLGLNYNISPENVNEADADLSAEELLSKMMKG